MNPNQFFSFSIFMLSFLTSYAQDSLSCCAETVASRFEKISAAVQVNKKIGDSKTTKMIFIKGGVFAMGSDLYADTKPLRNIELSDFWMDEHEVTNAQFAQFVEETGYVTLAERSLDPKDFPGVDTVLLRPSSAVFAAPERVRNLDDHMKWWRLVEGACWKYPEGKNSTLVGREHHPVVHIAHEDAAAYAAWAGKRLPTEAEWEYAARGGNSGTHIYYWGDELKPNNKWVANIYQGNFPISNTKEDGFETTSPVKSFPANPYGLYDMEGNVWEWCSDFYQPRYELTTLKNPTGPSSSFDPREPHVVKKVQRGGSFLCTDQYCERYKASTRGKADVNTSTNNVGFRCVKDI
ncbi:formylglycine-generating enzyme family protein [Sphingobacterium rhinopitheci]|uniref:formylglycine-generating enzyme family protein n=1 Tax=Sphingobacterium rhinopitheci TaxID=2781960 RepID=UPI001F522768|nr:formylglycine-generating enzyme family protein [Sphingobacterium rhinopitheci]MCI0920373.1 formylglycine-generating enzyme family protein [Sphingobacterium rhinopitheci]